MSLPSRPKLPGPPAPAGRMPGPELPVLLFLGAWVLLLSWEVAGVTGLLFPGFAGWVLWIVALVRARSGRRRAAAGNGRAVVPLRQAWLFSALAFAVLTGVTLFLGEGLPSSWRTTLAGALHIRHVDRHYSP